MPGSAEALGALTFPSALTLSPSTLGPARTEERTLLQCGHRAAPTVPSQTCEARNPLRLGESSQKSLIRTEKERNEHPPIHSFIHPMNVNKFSSCLPGPVLVRIQTVPSPAHIVRKGKSKFIIHYCIMKRQKEEDGCLREKAVAGRQEGGRTG